VSVSVGSNKFVEFSKVEFYEYTSGGSTTAAPTISGDTPFVGSTTVTITNAASADGADIYYTLNGDDPTTTTSETCFAYSAPFSIDATTTVKAIAKKSTDTKTQDEVKNATADVTVSSDQTAGSEANAVMTIPQGVVISGNVNPNEAFSVTAYEPAPEIVSADQVKVGQPLASDQPVMILDCTPNGAQFDKPVKLTVNVGTALAGQTLTIENNGEKVSSVVKIDGSVDFMVTHFSDWDLLFAPYVKNIEQGTKNLLSMSSFEIAKGTNTFSYIKNVGCQFNASGLIMDFIKSKFGETYTTVDETGSFESDGPGTGTLKVDQSYTTYTLGYGTISFTATVWGNVVATAQPNGGDAHSGGSGN
jgi:hypothetical protein